MACSPDNTVSITEETPKEETVVVETQQEESVVKDIPEVENVVKDIPEVENVVKDIQDTSVRDYRYNRGVLRYAPWQSIPLVSKATHAYEEKTIDPDHDYIDYFIYQIDFPQFNDDIACSKEINTAITNTMNSFINDKKSNIPNIPTIFSSIVIMC